MRKVYCAILGQTEIRTEGIRLTPEAERQFGMALYFCANAGREVARDDVAELFWPDHEIEAARHCLRQALYRLRAVGVPVRSGAKATTLDERVVDTDYASVAAEGAPLSAYLALSDVTVLPGYLPRFSGPFAEWVDGFRADVGAKLRGGLVRSISEARRRGRYADVERLARHCLALDPLNEEATLAMAESVALAGGKLEAVGMIERYVREVGANTELRLPARILRSRVSDLYAENIGRGRSRTPFVGRESETEWLLAHLAYAARRETLSVCLWGEGGVGKTAIVEAFLRIAALRNTSVVRIVCQRTDRGRPLSALCDIVSRLLQLPGALGAHPRSLAHLEPLMSYQRTRERGAEDAGTPDVVVPRLVESVCDVLDAVGDENPLIVHVDEAHWIDRESLRVLSLVLRSKPKRPLLIVTCVRTHPEHLRRKGVLLAAGRAQDRRVQPLSAADSRRLFLELLASSDRCVAEERLGELVVLTAGNPLFIVELATRLRESSAEDALPGTLRDLLDIRILGRSAEGIAVLQACSILGKHATVQRLEQLLELPAFELVNALTELEGSGLTTAVNDRVHCRHELICEAAQHTIAPSAAVLLRKRAAMILEQDALSSGDPAALWESAQHWEAAHQHADACRVLEQLSKYLLGIGSPREASQALERALQYCDTDAERMRLMGELLVCYRVAGDWQAIVRTIDDRTALIERCPEHRLDRDEDTVLYFEALIRSAERMDDVLSLVVEQLSSGRLRPDRHIALVQSGIILSDNTMNAGAARRIFSTLSVLDQSLVESDETALASQMIFHTTFGNLDDGVRIGSLIRSRVLTRQDTEIREAQRLRWVSTPLMRAGLFDVAEATLMQVLQIARQRRFWRETYEALDRLVVLALRRSDVSAARGWLLEATKSYEGTDDQLIAVSLADLRAEVALYDGQLTEADTLLQQVAPFAAKRPGTRPRLQFLSLKLAVGAARSQTVSREERDELYSLIMRSLDLGENDLGVGALARLLSISGEQEDRARLLAAYGLARRERYALPTFLAEHFWS